MRQILANLQKPTPTKWRARGNYAMAMIVALTLISDDLNDAPGLSETAIYWIKKGLVILLAFLKVYAENKVDHNIYTGGKS